jgi:hypothetical protein
MPEQASPKSETSAGTYSFTGAELAAIRLVELISNHPKVQALLERVSHNQGLLKAEVEKIATLIEDPAKRDEFIKIMAEKKPLEELKTSLIKFIGKNFEPHQIEYAINLMTDLRLGDLLKQGASVAQKVGSEVLSSFDKFARIFEETLRPTEQRR